MSELEKQIDALIVDCETCARTYREKPGLAGTETMIDLYFAIIRLARIVKAYETLRSTPAT